MLLKLAPQLIQVYFFRDKRRHRVIIPLEPASRNRFG
jgi:hypothetical protein